MTDRLRADLLNERDQRQRRFALWLVAVHGGVVGVREMLAARVLEQAARFAHSCCVNPEVAHRIIKRAMQGHSADAADIAGELGANLIACCEDIGISADQAEAHVVQEFTNMAVHEYRKRQRNNLIRSIVIGGAKS